MKNTTTINTERRSFLKGAAVTTVAASSGALAADTVDEEITRSPAKSNQGYKLTRHIKEYYRLARF